MYKQPFKNTLLGMVLFFVVAPVFGAIQGESVSYTDKDITMEGYLAWDDSSNKTRPGILVVHEWWGHNDYARKRARMLAEAGYLAMSIDMYGDGKVAAHPDQAGAFSSAAMENLEKAEKRFNAAMQVLNEHPLMLKNKMAAIGYCFGGGVVLHMARVGTDLKGVASFHGSLAAQVEAEKNQISAQVLVLHGADDPFIPQEKVKAFETEMKRANAAFEVIQYPGVTHSFTNPEADEFAKRFSLPLAYNREADEKSWQSLKDFLVKVFQ